MTCRPEHILLFFSALPESSDYIDETVDAILREGVDWEYLLNSAENYGVAAGLAELMKHRESVPVHLIQPLGIASEREKTETESMLGLYGEISRLLKSHSFDFIPLKGCDPRIAEGSRRVSNSMVDIDILVRLSDTEEVGLLLERHGFIYQGLLSGAHMNFFTDEKRPRFIEIHWDLVNRYNPLHRSLFSPVIESIWERSFVCDGDRLLSEEDLLAYLSAHVVKEYFQTPKWLADIAWLISNRLSLVDPERMSAVIDEWRVSHVLGFIADGLDLLLRDGSLEQVLAYGSEEPDILGRFVAKRLLCYDRLRMLRPVIFAAAAGTSVRLMGVAAASIQRLVQKILKE